MKRSLKMIVGATLTLGASLAIADKLSDFQDAAGRTGCETIPYSDLRGNCVSEQRNVHEYCDGARGPVSCGSEAITRQLKGNIDRERQSVQALKDKKRNFEDQKSRATDENEKNRLGKEIEQAGKDIYEGEKRVDKAVADLEVRKKFVDNAIYTIDKCIDYRRSVMNVFASALDKVRGEADENIKTLARQLRDKYEQAKSGHEVQITEKKNALETCKSSRP
jgi:hypothetical protein